MGRRRTGAHEPKPRMIPHQFFALELIRQYLSYNYYEILLSRIKSDLYGDITTRTHKDLFSLWIPMTGTVSMQVCCAQPHSTYPRSRNNST